MSRNFIKKKPRLPLLCFACGWLGKVRGQAEGLRRSIKKLYINIDFSGDVPVRRQQI